MTVQNKLRDLSLIIKHDRRVMFILAFGIFIVLFFMMYDSSKTERFQIPEQKQEVISSGGTAQKEAIEDLIQTMSTDLKAQGESVADLGSKVTDLNKSLSDNKQKTDELAANTMARIAEITAMVEAQKNNSATNTNVAPETIQPEKVEDLFNGQEPAAVVPPAPPAPKKVALISPGDSVQLELLAGVNAPTEGNPYPVVFKLASDVTGPDGSQLPLGEARIVAGANGSITDHRAIFRLTTLSYRAPNGARGEVKIDGWVVGEDGVVGMEGEMIDPLGKVIMAQGIAGTIQGIGAAVSQGQTNGAVSGQNSFITGDSTSYAAGQGVKEAGSGLSEAIKERAEKLIPQVRVLSGRKATAVFSQSVEIPGLYDQLEDQTENSAKFVSLD